jgi:AraC family transcriptional regulator
VTLRDAGVRVGTAVRSAEYPPGATFGPRLLTDYEFVWVLRGSATWTVRPAQNRSAGAATSQLLRPGTLALARAGTVDSYLWDPDQPSTHAYVHFGIDHIAVLGSPEGWPTTRDLSGLPVVAGLCDYLLELAGHESALARARSDQLVALLLDLYVRGPLESQPDRLQPLVAGAASHVRARWESDGPSAVSVRELAEAAHVSSGHLHRLFREAYGVGPARAFELVRLARAAVTLQRSNASLAQVAQLNGFANPYHFSRRFTATYGVPPGRFRADHADDDPLEPVRRQGLLPLSMALTR